MQSQLTAEILTDDLRRLGVRSGDDLMIHASLRAIGPLEGGPDTLLDALEHVVGADGTLLMILGAEIEHDWVNKLPEAERPALLAEAPLFDPDTAPAFHEVGYFAEVFRRCPGTLATNNPCGRFGARGRNAQELLMDAPWNDYYGPGSPLDRLCQQGGRFSGSPLISIRRQYCTSRNLLPTCPTSGGCAGIIAAGARPARKYALSSVWTTRTASSIGRAKTILRPSSATIWQPTAYGGEASAAPMPS